MHSVLFLLTVFSTHTFLTTQSTCSDSRFLQPTDSWSQPNVEHWSRTSPADLCGNDSALLALHFSGIIAGWFLAGYGLMLMLMNYTHFLEHHQDLKVKMENGQTKRKTKTCQSDGHIHGQRKPVAWVLGECVMCTWTNPHTPGVILPSAEHKEVMPCSERVKVHWGIAIGCRLPINT